MADKDPSCGPTNSSSGEIKTTSDETRNGLLDNKRTTTSSDSGGSGHSTETKRQEKDSGALNTPRSLLADASTFNNIILSESPEADSKGNRRVVANPNKGRNVHICGLPPRYTDLDLRSLFQRFGKIEHAKMMCTASKITRKTTGFVLFESATAATEAVRKMNHIRLENETLRVRLSKHGDGVPDKKGGGVPQTTSYEINPQQKQCPEASGPSVRSTSSSNPVIVQPGTPFLSQAFAQPPPSVNVGIPHVLPHFHLQTHPHQQVIQNNPLPPAGGSSYAKVIHHYPPPSTGGGDSVQSLGPTQPLNTFSPQHSLVCTGQGASTTTLYYQGLPIPAVPTTPTTTITTVYYHSLPPGDALSGTLLSPTGHLDGGPVVGPIQAQPQQQYAASTYSVPHQ